MEGYTSYPKKDKRKKDGSRNASKTKKAFLSNPFYELRYSPTQKKCRNLLQLLPPRRILPSPTLSHCPGLEYSRPLQSKCADRYPYPRPGLRRGARFDGLFSPQIIISIITSVIILFCTNLHTNPVLFTRWRDKVMETQKPRLVPRHG
jgi:hypothetical protein